MTHSGPRISGVQASVTGTYGLAAIAAGAWFAAAGLRFGQSLSVDEPFMANVVHGAWQDVTPVFTGDNLPLGYALLWIWTRIFGEGEFALRSLSMTAYAGAVFLTGLAARRLAGPWAGLLGAILAAASVTIGLSHASTARPYALLACLAAAATYVSVRIIERPVEGARSTFWPAAALLAVHLLGLFTHPTYALLVAALVMASWWLPREAGLRLAGAGVGAVLIYLMLWWPVLRATFAIDATSWMARSTWSDAYYAALLMWGTGRGALLAGVLVAVTLSTPAATARLIRTVETRWILTAASLAWALPLAISQWQPVFFPSRTPMLLLPVTMAALAVVIGRLANGPTLAVLGIIMASGPAIAAIDGLSKPDPAPTRASVTHVIGRAACGETLIAAGLSGDGVSFYLRRLGSPGCLRFQRFPADMRLSGQAGDSAENTQLLERARVLAADLAARRSTAWLFLASRGIGKEASVILETEVRGIMTCDEALPLVGAGFDRVLPCRAPVPGR